MQISKELWQAAQVGDEAAIAQVLLLVQPDLRRFAYRQCHRSSWIDDVVQEAMIIVQQRIGQVRQAPAFASWLMRVVARLCMLPALRLIQSASDLTQAETLRELSHKPAHELRLDLSKALHSLSASHREIILLRDVEECSMAEIAQQLNLSVVAAKSRLHRARTLMRDYLAGDDHA